MPLLFGENVHVTYSPYNHQANQDSSCCWAGSCPSASPVLAIRRLQAVQLHQIGCTATKCTPPRTAHAPSGVSTPPKASRYPCIVSEGSAFAPGSASLLKAQSNPLLATPTLTAAAVLAAVVTAPPARDCIG